MSFFPTTRAAGGFLVLKSNAEDAGEFGIEVLALLDQFLYSFDFGVDIHVNVLRLLKDIENRQIFLPVNV